MFGQRALRPCKLREHWLYLYNLQTVKHQLLETFLPNLRPALQGLLLVSSVLQTLHELGVQSLMVEGGARVIGSFLAERDSVDTVIITIAPKFVGSQGVGYGVDIAQVYLFPYNVLHIPDLPCVRHPIMNT